MESFLHNTWIVLNELAPWLLLGCFVAGLVYVWVPASFMTKHLGKGRASVFKAVFLGVPMPLCSCGVIPAAIGLKKQGAGNGASLGFLISTPQTGLDSILVSASFLSWPFAIFKLISAFALGIIGGLFADAEYKEEIANDVRAQDIGTQEKSLASVYEFAINDLLYMIWKWLVFGVLVSAAITTWVPEDAISQWGSLPLIYALFAVLIISVPLYVCATSSVPVAAALVHAGMPPSAALVFLMAGPATNFATIGAVYKGFGGRNLIVYLATIIVGSITLAYFFDFVVQASSITGDAHEHFGIVSNISVYLLLLFFLSFLFKDLKGLIKTKKGPEDITFTVSGMTCNGCVNKLKTSLSGIENINGVEIDLESGSVTVYGSDIPRKKIADSVEKIGYQHSELLK